MGVLGGVYLVPEDVTIGVRADAVVVATSQGSQEVGAHVAGAGGVCEAQLHRKQTDFAAKVKNDNLANLTARKHWTASLKQHLR